MFTTFKLLQGIAASTLPGLLHRETLSGFVRAQDAIAQHLRCL